MDEITQIRVGYYNSISDEMRLIWGTEKITIALLIQIIQIRSNEYPTGPGLGRILTISQRQVQGRHSRHSPPESGARPPAGPDCIQLYIIDTQWLRIG